MEAGLIFLIVFLVIVAALILVAVYGSRKDKRDRIINTNKLNEDQLSAHNSRIKIYILLYYLNKRIKKDLKKVNEPGALTTSDINNYSKDIVKKIIESPDYLNIKKSEDISWELTQVLDSLQAEKPINWEKQSFFAIALVEAKSKFYIKDPSNKEIKKNITKVINEL